MSNAKEVVRDWKDNKGFPFYPEDKKWRDKEYASLSEFKRENLWDRTHNIIINQHTNLSLAWSYMKHALDIKCGKMKTPVEI